MKEDGTMTFVESFIQQIKNLRLFSVCKLSIGLISIIHLILANIHVAGLLKLENEICGFVMFVSIIFGLVCFFQASRSKLNNKRELIPLQLFIVITLSSLIALAGIYLNAINSQISLKDPTDVIKALNLTISMIVLYSVAFIAVLIDYLLNGRKFNGEKKDEE